MESYTFLIFLGDKFKNSVFFLGRNGETSCFGLLLGWVAVAWLGFGVMTKVMIQSSILDIQCMKPPFTNQNDKRLIASLIIA